MCLSKKSHVQADLKYIVSESYAAVAKNVSERADNLRLLSKLNLYTPLFEQE